MDLLRVLAALFIVFGLLGALHFFSRRGGKRSPLPELVKFSLGKAGIRANNGNSPAAEQVRVIKRLNLSATHQIHLLQIDKENILLCTHPQGCTVLRSSDEPASTGRFAEVQKRAS